MQRYHIHRTRTLLRSRTFTRVYTLSSSIDLYGFEQILRRIILLGLGDGLMLLDASDRHRGVGVQSRLILDQGR